MDLLFSASLIASFLAGMVALFAPCCITVLLPSYMASAFREKKNLLKMTVIFFAGIATVLIPIGLGAAALAQVFQSFHQQLYIIGGLFMVGLAIMSIMGKGMSLVPMPKLDNVNPDPMHPRSVYVLGVFSGAATSCCAPVLAGAMTLAVLSGSFWNALLVTFAYVFGMTFPLFLSAYFYDHFKIENSSIIRGKLLTFKWFGKTVYVHTTNLLSATIFALVGVMLLYLAQSGNEFWSPEWQAQFGQSLNVWSAQMLARLSVIPSPVWLIVILGLFGYFVIQSF